MQRSTLYYTLSIEVVIQNATKNRYSLPDEKTLRERYVKGISIRRQNANGDRETITGNALVSDADLGKCFLSLQSDSVNFIDRLPVDFIAIDPDSETIQDRFVKLDLPNGFDPTKSFIDISDPSGFTANEAIEITFIYDM